jgi:hypothetical protein
MQSTAYQIPRKAKAAATGLTRPTRPLAPAIDNSP